MEKTKYIIISLVAGIISAIILFIFFAFGAMFGSHLRFFGYKRLHNKNIISSHTITGEILSLHKNNLFIKTIDKKDMHVFLNKHDVIKSQNKSIPPKRSSLKKGIYVYIQRFKDKLYITMI